MSQAGVRVRKCDCEADADAIHILVTELAIFERCPDAVKLSVADYRRDGFETKPPLFFAALGEVFEGDKWTPVGLLLCYYKYSTWEGRSIHMEDLFVLPSHRRKGIATMLFEHCVAVAKAERCRRVEWNVLDWNEGAKKFYNTLGATIPDAGAWELMRLDEAGIERFVPGRKQQ